MTKWPYSTNAVFRIVKNHGEQCCFIGFRGDNRTSYPLTGFASAAEWAKQTAERRLRVLLSMITANHSVEWIPVKIISWGHHGLHTMKNLITQNYLADQELQLRDKIWAGAVIYSRTISTITFTVKQQVKILKWLRIIFLEQIRADKVCT